MKTTAVFPQGEQLWDLRKHEEVVLPVPIECHLTARATGVLRGSIFAGDFQLHNLYLVKQGPDAQQSFEITGIGEFEFQLR